MPNNGVQNHDRKRVAYYYDCNVGNFYYGQGHVMKPHRIRMTHQLLLAYGLYRHLDVYRPFPASVDEMSRFHSEQYIDFLRSATSETQFSKQTLNKFNVGGDCPLFDGLFQFCQLSTGGSLAAAAKLNKQKAEIAINWMGGLHHAKHSKASGFCYTNDIVLGILELLKYHKRVLYVDIDVHHGDGVEEAFYTTDRVMTVSFHKYGRNFFPESGELAAIGADSGSFYTVNVPLKDGITDETYQLIFQPIMHKVMEVFQPCAVVLQCGADSLSEDRLGTFNLTLNGHGKCVQFFRDSNVPLILLGGGGYIPRNVARCWTYETALALNEELSDDLPYNDFFEYFAPNYCLHINADFKVTNLNTENYLRTVQNRVFENLSNLSHVPSVQMQEIPEDGMQIDESAAQDEANPDRRLPAEISDHMTAHPGEFYDGENEGEDRRNRHKYKRNGEKKTNDEQTAPMEEDEMKQDKSKRIKKQLLVAEQQEDDDVVLLEDDANNN
ncbi:hypothetical protein niasHT_028586 [Heterodera trifolii]|uniref:Histone deacetylase n=1 Tax=Heterodera trifolii TaxID=157864 RepID=A0ABD2KAD2_9BILA